MLTRHDKFHKVYWFCHFAEGLTLRWVDVSGNVIMEENGYPFVIVIPPKGVCVEINSGLVSQSYGEKRLNPTLQLNWEVEIPPISIHFSWKFTRAKLGSREVR